MPNLIIEAQIVLLKEVIVIREKIGGGLRCPAFRAHCPRIIPLLSPLEHQSGGYANTYKSSMQVCQYAFNSTTSPTTRPRNREYLFKSSAYPVTDSLRPCHSRASRIDKHPQSRAHNLEPRNPRWSSSLPSLLQRRPFVKYGLDENRSSLRRASSASDWRSQEACEPARSNPAQSL